MKMITKNVTESAPFDTLKDAEEYLIEHGWKQGHAGMWFSPFRPNVTREIRRPKQRKFVIFQTEPAPLKLTGRMVDGDSGGMMEGE